jgi:FdhD protein
MDSNCAIALPRAMLGRQELFRKTGASHAAALFDEAGELLTLAEDVGRHNAFDKAIGQLWLDGRLRQAYAVALSGRASMEMVRKATRANLALMVGVSAPTAQAVAEACRAHITLLGFARGDAATLYTPPWHLGEPCPDQVPTGLASGGSGGEVCCSHRRSLLASKP